MSRFKRKPFDREKVFEMASKAHTNIEIADECGVNERTLRRRAMKELQRGRMQRDRSLRQKQFEMAMAGNATMLVFLGKVLLGQTERTEITGANGGPIQYERADLKQLSDTELDELAKLVDKATEDVRRTQKEINGMVAGEKTEEAPGQP